MRWNEVERADVRTVLSAEDREDGLSNLSRENTKDPRGCPALVDTFNIGNPQITRMSWVTSSECHTRHSSRVNQGSLLHYVGS